MFDPMHRVVPGREKSLETEIEDQRNTDHNGALPLHLPLVGENYDFKQSLQIITKSGTDFSRHTWAE
eukprot:10155650-Karenia_brevis.AAC.1